MIISLGTSHVCHILLYNAQVSNVDCTISPFNQQNSDYVRCSSSSATLINEIGNLLLLPLRLFKSERLNVREFPKTSLLCLLNNVLYRCKRTTKTYDYFQLCMCYSILTNWQDLITTKPMFWMHATHATQLNSSSNTCKLHNRNALHIYRL